MTLAHSNKSRYFRSSEVGIEGIPCPNKRELEGIYGQVITAFNGRQYYRFITFTANYCRLNVA